jgi:hypothetical protein
VQIGFTGVCVSVQIWDLSFGVVFFPEHSILNFLRLKVKVKVDFLKLTLKLVFYHIYFKILGQKTSKSFYLENIKVGPRDDYMD